MRVVNRVLVDLHDRMAQQLEPGISAAEIDRQAEEFLQSSDVIPAFPGYNGYKHVISFCQNEEVVHSPPVQSKIVQSGDLVTLDCAGEFDGWFGDVARTHVVGEVNRPLRELAEAPAGALETVTADLRPGMLLTELSQMLYNYGRARGLSVVTSFGGHGIGTSLHQDPRVPNGPHDNPMELNPGMTLALEPIYTLGTGTIKILEDGWTVVTKDGSLSAHSEWVIHVDKDGAEILAC